jgi:Phosphate-selective porin O and P
MRTLSRIVPAVAAALLAVLPAGASAQQSDATSVDAAILDVLLARGLIDQAQYEELLAMVHDRVESQRGEIELIEGRLARLRAPDVQTSGGQSGKLLFKSPDGKWSLGFKGRIQARVEHLNSEDNTQNATNISVPRSRVGFEGTAGAENVRYRLEFDINTQKNIVDPSTAGTVSAKSIYIDWGFENGLALLLGQTEYPFGREALTSSANISFAERSIVFSQFEPEYEPLAMLYAKANEGEWEYYAAVSNGEGSGENNTAGTDQNGMRKGARVVWNPLGAMKNDGPAFQTYETGGTLLGLGVNYMDNEENSGLNTATPGTDTDTVGYDAQMFAGPVSIMAEFIQRTSYVSGGPNVDDDGRTLQVGWLVTHKWEVVGRRAEIDFDVAEDQQQTTFGLNYYVDRHNGKWMLEWDKVDTDGAAPDKQSVRVQYQVIF